VGGRGWDGRGGGGRGGLRGYDVRMPDACAAGRRRRAGAGVEPVSAGHYLMDATVTRRDSRLLAHNEARAIVCGVLLPVFMGSVDTTILAGALPTIGRELGQVHALPWLVTAYLVASTPGTPLYRQNSDLSRP